MSQFPFPATIAPPPDAYTQPIPTAPRPHIPSLRSDPSMLHPFSAAAGGSPFPGRHHAPWPSYPGDAPNDFRRHSSADTRGRPESAGYGGARARAHAHSQSQSRSHGHSLSVDEARRPRTSGRSSGEYGHSHSRDHSHSRGHGHSQSHSRNHSHANTPQRSPRRRDSSGRQSRHSHHRADDDADADGAKARRHTTARRHSASDAEVAALKRKAAHRPTMGDTLYSVFGTLRDALGPRDRY